MSVLNWNAFAEYHNKHEGASAVLFGSGPTILEFNSGQLPPDVLRYGVNDQIFLNLNLILGTTISNLFFIKKRLFYLYLLDLSKVHHPEHL